MKQLKMFSGKMYFLEDDEAENVKKMILENMDEPIELRDGSLINPKGWESLGAVETKPFYRGMPMSADMTRVFSQGEWKTFSGDRKEIEHRPLINNNLKIK